MPPHATLTSVLESVSPAAVSGWLELRGSAGNLSRDLAAAFYYNFSINQRLVDSTGVSAAERVRLARFPVESSNRVNTGMAIRLSTTPLDFFLYDADGTLLQFRHTRLNGARFFRELFAEVPLEFLGHVEIRGEEPFFLTVLRQELTNNGFQLTTVPVQGSEVADP